MTLATRLIALAGALVVAAAMLPDDAGAAGFFNSIRDKTVLKECGACHMPYPGALLPTRSWELIIGHLTDHFGDNAAMPAPTQQAILDYYTANAGDAPGRDGWFMRGIPANVTPPRITRMPFWRAIHGNFPAGAFKRANVRKPGNCIGCHR